MNLIAIKQFMAERKLASLSEIAMHFKTEADAARPLLEVWVAKGKMKKTASAQKKGCSGCCQCSTANHEVYEWVANEVGSATLKSSLPGD